VVGPSSASITREVVEDGWATKLDCVMAASPVEEHWFQQPHRCIDSARRLDGSKVSR